MIVSPDGLDIQPEHWKTVRKILQRHVPGSDVWAFGSRTRGIARQYSDLDLAIMSDRSLSLDRLAALKEAFSQSDLPWKVDVLDWASVSVGFRERIADHRIVVQRGAWSVVTP